MRGGENEKQALVFYRVEVINTSFVCMVLKRVVREALGSTSYTVCASEISYDTGT
jgi:hypothetical protein